MNPKVSLMFSEAVEYRCDHGHTTDGDSKSNTSFKALWGAEGESFPAPWSGCKPVVCNGVPVLPDTLSLPDGTQEMSFVLGDTSPAYICIDGFSTSVGDFGRMKADFTLMCSANGMFKVATNTCIQRHPVTSDHAPQVRQARRRSRPTRPSRILVTALAALGETDSVEARGLQFALEDAKRAAQERPLAAQVEECQACIKRSQGKLARSDQERDREQKEVDAALARMARFRDEMSWAVPDFVAEIERLRSRVAEMETEREEARKKRFGSLSVPSPDLVGGPDLSLQDWGALHDDHVGRGRGAIMETSTSRGSTLAANLNRFSRLA